MAEVKERDSKAFTGLLDQKQVNYSPLSPEPGVKACANCRWFKAASWDNDPPECHLVRNYPEPILATGLSDRWEGSLPTTPDISNPLPVVIVPMEEVAVEEMALPTSGKGLVETIRTVVTKMFRTEPAPLKEDSFSVFKATNGKHYWLARHTGKFKDREAEILADKAHEEYVDRVSKGLVPMPELWTWHTKGTRHGQADIVWKSGGFLLAVGHFDDTPEAKCAIEFYQKNAGNIKLSHMFNYPKSAKQNGVYYAYNTIEITTLPDGAEAFPYTSFEEFKPMPLSEQQREFIRGVGGDEMLKRAESADTKAITDTKTLEALGVESKGLGNFDNATIPAAKSELEAVKAVQADIETRLKTVEGLPAQVKTLNETIRALQDQVSASQQAESQSLAKANDLEKQLLELKALQPPASQSSDTLLNTREKALLDTLMTEAKVNDAPSLVDRLVGGQPTVATGA
ncbi:MAG: hypothetical protein H0X30_01330 [Anaerolineae bacterium]|nr:hypothetical protein [Anaerolineae bacterium]